ncbi:MAG: hypothetical protein ACI85Q_001367 [Salibacteraceae bacterium]|jgi:hypothetical protein
MLGNAISENSTQHGIIRKMKLTQVNKSSNGCSSSVFKVVKHM